ncbi:hypothetical protein E4T49_08456 [Aureobasidium sp. EXF-10728]|nr:hypothetical protein E4T49_08456 [Aureobasidium sp. EXF-10728]
MPSTTDVPMRERQQVPAKALNTPYPRVLGYARPGDYLYGVGFGASIPAAMTLMERVSPSGVSRSVFASAMRLSGGIGICAGFFLCYSRSISASTHPAFFLFVHKSLGHRTRTWEKLQKVANTASKNTDRFYGFTENRREIDMDMREMVDKVKRGEELYGKSQMTEYMQGVASRQSRYSGIWIHMMPWFNFVNHNQHGVDTAKYYQQAERELEAEKA